MRANLIGMTFCRLTVISEQGKSVRNDIMWLCKCTCGNETTLPTRKLKGGEVKSCGCYKGDYMRSKMTTHDHARTRTYTSWNSMKNRCTNPNHISYANYGGRGISICDRWVNSFENFLYDMGERPTGKTLDRINTNGIYEPLNCKWSTLKEQQRNRRYVRKMEYNGEIKTLPEWCDILNLNKTKVLNKFRYKEYTVVELIACKNINKTGY